MFSIDGLVSGLDTSSIIQGLLALQQSRLDRLNLRKDEILLEQSAFSGIEANVLSLQSAVNRLASFTNNVFAVRAATSSDESILTASAASNAASGTYVMRVTQLARAEQIASQGFSSAEALITEGTLTLGVGNRPTVNVVIDSTNNTVQGLADAINNSTSDLTATLVNDGSGVRLLLTSAHTGAANTINISSNFDPPVGNQVEPDFSGPPVQSATDSEILLGSGAGAISIRQSSNLVEDVIEGVTLNLIDVDADRDILLVIENDIEPARTAIEGFVDAFNSVVSYIDEQTAYESETETAGLLLGNNTASNIRDQFRNLLARVIPNLNSNANRLSAIGIEFDDNGRLQLDSGKLDSALRGRLEGVTIEDVRRIFALDAQTGDSNVSFVLGSSETRPSDQPYQLHITQAAQRAAIAATNSLGPTIDIDNTNNQFSIMVDGQQSELLTLTNGSYTATQLAQHVQDTINLSNELNGRTVRVTTDGSFLSIESDAYGTKSEVGNLSGSALPALGFDGSEYQRGTDVAGYFDVNGTIESATGKGRILTGDAGNANTAGLQLRVTLNQTQVGAGFQSDVTVTQGFASKLNNLIEDMQDEENGRFKVANQAFDDRVASIESSINRLNDLFEAKQQQLINEFVGIEATLSQLQTISSFLSTQFVTANSLGQL